MLGMFSVAALIMSAELNAKLCEAMKRNFDHVFG